MNGKVIESNSQSRAEVGVGWARPKNFQTRKNGLGSWPMGPAKIVIFSKNNDEIVSFCVLKELFFIKLKCSKLCQN